MVVRVFLIAEGQEKYRFDFMIPKEKLEEFKRIYKEQFGKDISDQEALESAISLLTLMKAIYKPIKGKDKGTD